MLFSTKIAPRYSESMIFRVPEVPKWTNMEAKMASSGNPAPRASWKALGLDVGSIWASILVSEMALETLENDIKNKTDFKRRGRRCRGRP